MPLQEYPKWVHPPGGGEVLVHDATQEAEVLLVAPPVFREEPPAPAELRESAPPEVLDVPAEPAPVKRGPGRPPKAR